MDERQGDWRNAAWAQYIGGTMREAETCCIVMENFWNAVELVTAFLTTQQI